MKAPLSYVPALQPLMGWIAGILIFWSGGEAVWACVAAAIGLMLLIMRRHVLGFALATCACGYVIAWLATPTPAPAICTDGHFFEYSGQVVMARNSAESQTYHITVDSIAGNGCASFVAEVFTSAGGHLHPRGTRLHFIAQLQSTNLPKDFDTQPTRRAYYAEHAITAQGFADKQKIKAVGLDKSWRTIIDGLRSRVLHRLARCGLSDAAFGVLGAMILAQTDDLPADVRENFRAAGIAHVLALSGFHVGVIVLIMELLLWPLRIFTRLRQLRLLLMIIAVWAFALIVGMPWSVIRAAIMLSVYLLGLILGRPANPYNSLCVALLVILAINPFALFSAGLHLSVCAVLGILLFTKILNPINPRHRMAYNAMGVVAASVGAVLGTLVPTIVHFHSLPIAFLPANIAMAVVMPAMMIGGILIAALPTGCAVSAWIGMAETWMVDTTDSLAQWIGGWPMSTINNLYFSNIEIVCLIAIIASMAVAVNFNAKRWYAMSAVAIIVAVGAMIATHERYDDEEVVVLRSSPCATFLLRHHDSLMVVPMCRPTDIYYVKERITRNLDAYIGSRGVNRATITTGDFSLGNFSRRGEVMMIGSRSIAIPTTKGHSAKSDYLLLTSLTKERPDSLAKRYQADTVLLCPMLSLRRARALQQAFSPTPTRRL